MSSGGSSAKVSRAGVHDLRILVGHDGEQRPHPVVPLERQQAAGREEAQVPGRVRGPDDRDQVPGLDCDRWVALDQGEQDRALALGQTRAGHRPVTHDLARGPERLDRAAIDGDANAARVAEREPEPFPRFELVLRTLPDQTRKDAGAVRGDFGPRVLLELEHHRNAGRRR